VGVFHFYSFKLTATRACSPLENPATCAKIKKVSAALREAFYLRLFCA